MDINPPALGVIEGFFGRPWSWSDRQLYAKFIALNNLNFYIYAPKNDAFLRKNWHQDWPKAEKHQLIQLREEYASCNIEFGIGLSPFEVYLDNSSRSREQLHQRIQQINDLSPDILCLLFDDMRGDTPNLANIQIDLMHQVASATTAKRIIFCPTYYSFDPVLEKVFGKMPGNYWQMLNTQLDKSIDIFWTGEKVCSAKYSTQHLTEVSNLLGRKPFLWDNYPVNDGAAKSNHLHLRGVDNSHSQIQQHVAGHALNPMNQAWLSQFAIASLTQAYTQGNSYNATNAFAIISQALCGKALAAQLQNDLPLLQDKGLLALSTQDKALLLDRYGQFTNNPYCLEIIDWLQGGYTFDPACLTG